MTTAVSATYRLTASKQCKSAVVYSCSDPNASIASVYVNRSFAATMPNAIELTINGDAGATMRADKQCVHSVRYATSELNAAVSQVYVKRTFANPMPPSITLAVEAA